MRYVAAPWAALLESGKWLDNARHANAMAKLLERELRGRLIEVPPLQGQGHPIRYEVGQESKDRG